jgi:hypothetical protein
MPVLVTSVWKLMVPDSKTQPVDDVFFPLDRSLFSGQPMSEAMSASCINSPRICLA